MRLVNQVLVIRDSYEVDEGTMGFHDYVTKKENFQNFVSNVTNKANDLAKSGNKILNIAYPNEDTAIIVYKEAM